MYQGDYLAASTVVFNFNTASFADGSPITLGGTPALSVYKNSTTESTSGITLTVDYDSRTGMHHVVIDTSSDGTFYAAGNDFDVIITTGTVGGTSVVGRKVGSFSLENRTQKADLRKVLGTACTAATAGILDTNAKLYNNQTTQTDANNLPKVDIEDFGGAAGSFTSGKPAVKLTNTDVTGNLAADVQTIKTQAVTCSAGVTVGAFVGNATAALAVDASGRVDLGKALGSAITCTAAGVIDVNSKNIGGTLQTGLDLGGTWTAARAAHLDADISSRMATFTLPTNFSALGIGATGHILVVDTCTTNTDMRGTDSAALAATALSTVQWTNTRAGNLDKLDQAITTILTTAMTESYAAKGATMTAAQALYLLQSWLTNFAVASTTYTAKKLDGTTAAATGTLDSATTPTQNLRAT